MLEELCQYSTLPCVPIEVSGSMVHRVDIDDVGEGVVAAFELAEGHVPSLTASSDITAMGEALARLHTAMARLRPRDLGPFAAMALLRPGVLSEVGLEVRTGLIERLRSRVAAMPRCTATSGPITSGAGERR